MFKDISMKLHLIYEGLRGIFTDKEFKPKTSPGIGVTSNAFKAYTSPKFLKILSEKLSSLVDLDIVIAISPHTFHAYQTRKKTGEIADHPARMEELAKITEMTIPELNNSIILIIRHDNDQPAVTPWMIVHQIAEGIIRNKHGYDLWHAINNTLHKYAHYFKKVSRIDKKDWQDYDIYTSVFKMRSARLAKQNNQTAPQDPIPELLTEFLWHGRRIRVAYPEGIDPTIIDSLKKEITDHINGAIDSLRGQILYNAL